MYSSRYCSSVNEIDILSYEGNNLLYVFIYTFNSNTLLEKPYDMNQDYGKLAVVFESFVSQIRGVQVFCSGSNFTSIPISERPSHSVSQIIHDFLFENKGRPRF